MIWEEFVKKIKEEEGGNRFHQTLSIPGFEFTSSGGISIEGSSGGSCKFYDGYTFEQLYDIYKALRKK